MQAWHKKASAVYFTVHGGTTVIRAHCLWTVLVTRIGFHSSGEFFSLFYPCLLFLTGAAFLKVRVVDAYDAVQKFKRSVFFSFCLGFFFSFLHLHELAKEQFPNKEKKNQTFGCKMNAQGTYPFLATLNCNIFLSQKEKSNSVCVSHDGC